MNKHHSIAARAVAAALLLAFAHIGAMADAPSKRIRAFENGLSPQVIVEGEPEVRWTLAERMRHYGVPAVSVAVIRDGRIVWTKAYGVKQAGTRDAADTNTVFSVGSVSKVGAAAVTLRLVDAGKLSLDRDVNEYLQRWRVPGNEFTAISPVTLRGILSHSAGLTLHGFPDFQPNEPLPTIIDTLEGRAPAKTEPVRVDYVPGSRWRYSGGGTTVEQLVIEDVTGLDFPEAARRLVFEPLGMSRSTYMNPLPAEHGNIARAHDERGQPAALPRGWETFPEMAASGLWTTPTDLARLVIAFIDAHRGRSGFLGAALAREMMTEVGLSPYGLGPQLAGEGRERRFYHGGANDSYNAWIEGNLFTGDGVVILGNGAESWSLQAEVRDAIAAVEGWPQTQVRRVPRLQLSEQEMQAVTGRYVAQRAGIDAARGYPPPPGYIVTLDQGVLYLSHAGKARKYRLVPETASHYIVEGPSMTGRAQFVPGYDGRIHWLRFQDRGHVTEAARVTASP